MIFPVENHGSHNNIYNVYACTYTYIKQVYMYVQSKRFYSLVRHVCTDASSNVLEVRAVSAGRYRDNGRTFIWHALFAACPGHVHLLTRRLLQGHHMRFCVRNR